MALFTDQELKEIADSFVAVYKVIRPQIGTTTGNTEGNVIDSRATEQIAGRIVAAKIIANAGQKCVQCLSEAD